MKRFTTALSLLIACFVFLALNSGSWAFMQGPDASVPIPSTLASGAYSILAGGQGSLATGATIYVDADATGANNGSSWADAFTNLQSALDAAATGDEIWVAAGIYKPATEYGGTGDRYKSFQMKNGVALYGGFDPSVGDTGFEDRDWVSHVTILSGDTGTQGDPDDNSYHVFYHPSGTNLDSTAILDGFTVTGGSSPTLTDCRYMPPAPEVGAGMFNDGSSPALRNCTFSDNHAHCNGGGMFNYKSSPTLTNCTFRDNSTGGANVGTGGGMFNDTSSPTLTGCTFSGNSARYSGGMGNHKASPLLNNCTFSDNSAGTYGGGMENYGSSPTLTGCTFQDNSAGSMGGGMENEDSSATLTDCTFSGNSAGHYGGGMENVNSSPALTNCTFSRNSAGERGGGMDQYYTSSPVLTNCTFSGNSANAGGAIYNYTSSSPLLTNCILWGDTAQEIFNYQADDTPVVASSDVQGGFPGAGNLDEDPRFVNAAGGEFHLWPDSPCIDAGDNAAPNLPPYDFEGDNRLLDGDGDGTAIVDMGVDEAFWRSLYVPVVLR